MELDSGEVLSGTITSIRSPGMSLNRITARAKTWSRWRGTPDDVVDVVKKAVAEITARSSEDPAVSIRISFGADEEERYFDVATFENDIRSNAPMIPGGRLREIEQLDLTVGPTRNGGMKANATFARSAPAVKLSMEGTDRAVAGGLKDELASSIDHGRPRIPAPNQALHFFIGGILGAAYSVAFWSIDWGFLPGVWPELIIVLLLNLGGFLALLYAYQAASNSLLPPLALARPDEKTRSQSWMPRVWRVVGALGLATFPFLLDRFFG